MAFDNNIVIVGNLTRDPELRFTQSGVAVCSLGVAWNQRSGPNGGEDKSHFFNVTCWRELAENCAETLTKGCLLYTSPSPRDQRGARMPSSA